MKKGDKLILGDGSGGDGGGACGDAGGGVGLHALPSGGSAPPSSFSLLYHSGSSGVSLRAGSNSRSGRFSASLVVS